MYSDLVTMRCALAWLVGCYAAMCAHCNGLWRAGAGARCAYDPIQCGAGMPPPPPPLLPPPPLSLLSLLMQLLLLLLLLLLSILSRVWGL